MHEQLALLRPDDRSWRLDEQTREIGRRGVDEARAALRKAATGRRPAPRRPAERALTRRPAA